MSALLFSFLQMTVLIVLGVILRKTRVIDERVQKGLSNILIYAVLPFNLVSSSQYEYSREMILALIAVAGASLCYFTFSGNPQSIPAFFRLRQPESLVRPEIRNIYIICSGWNTSSKRSGVRKPSFTQASFRLMFSLKASFAVLAAFS